MQRAPLHSTNTTSVSGSSNSLFRAPGFEDGIRLRQRVPAEQEGVPFYALSKRLEALAATRNADTINPAPQLPEHPKVSFRGAAFNKLKGNVKLLRQSLPGDFKYARFGKVEYPNVMRAVGRALRKHKRKILIGGAAIGATAGILGGALYGGLHSEPNYKSDPYIDRSSTGETKKKMQYDKPVGVFEKMSNAAAEFGGGGGGGGGSGGGGYGNYQKMFQAAQGFGKTRRRRRHAKKASVGKAPSRKTRRGKVSKRRRVKKHINKRARKTRRHYKRKAF